MNAPSPNFLPTQAMLPRCTERSGLFADLIAEMDYRVGQVMGAIKEAGVGDNTIVILQRR